MSIIEHIFFFSLLFMVYAFWGKNNADRSGTTFWVAAIVPILLYVCIVGSRYGWGADYLAYKFRFEYAFTYLEEQVAFRWLNQFLNYIGFNYVGAFMVYAFIFIVCAFVFIRSYGKPSMYMYCFLVPATLSFPCGIIRQGVGLSFIFLALTFFYQRKWQYMILATLIALNIHFTTIVTLATILGIFFIIRKPIHYLLSIPLYLFFAIVFDVTKIGFMAGFLNKYITLSNKFQSYIDNSEYWFGTEAVNDIYEQSTFALIMSSLYYVSLFYLGYQALKIRENIQVLYMYNTVVLGSILLRATFLYEILRRFAQPMEMFYFIPMGYVFYVYFQDCKYPETDETLRLKKHFQVGIIFILAYLFMYWGRFIFLNPNADFFWYH